MGVEEQYVEVYLYEKVCYDGEHDGWVFFPQLEQYTVRPKFNIIHNKVSSLVYQHKRYVSIHDLA